MFILKVFLSLNPKTLNPYYSSELLNNFLYILFFNIVKKYNYI